MIGDVVLGLKEIRSANLARGLLLLLLLWGCYRYLVQLSLTYFPNSDNANPLLTAADMLHGNWTLRGWWTTIDGFWLTDLPFYVVGEALKGLTPSLMHEVPAAIYLGVLVLVVCGVLAPLSREDSERPQTRAAAVMIALMPLLFPGDIFGHVVLLGGYHIGPTGFVLGSLLLIHRAVLSGRGRRFVALVVAATALLAAAILSDPLAFWIGAVPAIVTSVLLLHRRPASMRGYYLVPASVAIAASLIALMSVLVLLALPGGLALASPVEPRVPQFSANVSLFVQGFLELFGANFIGMPVSLRTLPVWSRLVVCIAVLASIDLHFRDVRKRSALLPLLLSSSMVVVAAIFVFSPAPADIWSTRYLVSIVVFGCVLLGLRIREAAVLKDPKRSAFALLTILVATGLYASTPIARLRQPASALTGKMMVESRDWPSVSALGSWLATHGLRQGYGEYWSASIVTVATRGAVSVRPVISLDGAIRPYEWIAKCDWFREPGARFIVMKDSPRSADLRTVVLTSYGPTAIHYDAAYGYTVFEWNHPIALKLSPIVPGFQFEPTVRGPLVDIVRAYSTAALQILQRMMPQRGERSQDGCAGSEVLAQSAMQTRSYCGNASKECALFHATPRRFVLGWAARRAAGAKETKVREPVHE